MNRKLPAGPAPSRADAEQPGPIRRILTKDHRRIDRLLDAAGSCGKPEELAAYDKFRRALLRHIGMEEKILFPAAQRLRGGDPLAEAARLRLDHGAIVALLMPAPSRAVVRALRTVLAAHNAIEEGPGGTYDVCDRLAAGERDELLRRLKEAPEVPTNPNVTNAQVLKAARRALERAGYDPALLDE
jgi:Hemerythrin HHE cation binding domain